jgi:dihydroorotate dehydrogenase electron transfer subunit
MQHRLEKPRIVTIKNTVRENQDTTSFFFIDEEARRAAPGQFLMVWLPGVDEIPISLSQIGEAERITICAVGDATKKFAALKKGDSFGIRGPYGNGFALTGKNLLFVAGGMGLAPLMPLISLAANKKNSVTVLVGARSKSKLFFIDELKKMEHQKLLSLYIATDDGSLGEKCFVSELVVKTLESDSTIEQLFTCGPEPMMCAILALAKRYGVSIQASLERYMKCGFGICGHCCLDDSGVRACTEGPVFDERALEKITEFGRYRRDESGSKISYKKV